jgi:hypothetical protein
MTSVVGFRGRGGSWRSESEYDSSVSLVSPRTVAVLTALIAACASRPPEVPPKIVTPPKVDAPVTTCPGSLDAAAIDAFSKRHQAAFGTLEAVSASLPHSFTWEVDREGFHSRYETTIDAKRYYRKAPGEDAGVDAQGAWSLGPGGVLVRLRPDEATDLSLDAWITRRGYLVDKPVRAQCKPGAGFEGRMSLWYSKPGAFDVELGFELDTAQLQDIHVGNDGGPIGAMNDRILTVWSWTEPDARGVRWLGSTFDPFSYGEPSQTKLVSHEPLPACSGPVDCFSPAAQPFAMTWPPSGKVTIPMQSYLGEVLVNVRVGNGDVRAFLDSGAGITLLDAATPLGVSQLSGAATTIGGAAQKIDVHIGELAELHLGDLTLTRLPTATAAIPLLENVGEKRPDLILGVSLFQSAAVRIDYAKNEVVFAKDAKDVTGAGASAIPIRMIDAMLLAGGDIEGWHAIWQIDTGSTGSFGLDKSYASPFLLGSPHPTIVVQGIFDGGANETTQTIFRYESASIGTIEAKSGLSQVSPRPPNTHKVAGTVGNGVLGRCKAVVFDLANRQLLVEGPCTGPVKENRSGMRLVKKIDASDAGTSAAPWVVGFVVPGSAADAAGLKKGDRILTVAKKAATLDLERMAKLFEQPAGTKVDVGYARDGAKKSATLVLADMLPKAATP